jgi:photosystem II stability/assembly factor-like uncharacterized protein
LWDVAAVSADVAVACDLSGGVWRTADDGITWSLAYQEPNHRILTDLESPVPGLIVAVGDRVVLRSTDDGITWTHIAHEDVEEVLTDQKWFDAENGIFSGHFGIFRTADGGLTMTPSVVDGPDVGFLCLDVRGDTGIAVGWDGYSVAFTFASDDGGDTWTIVPGDVLPWVYDVVILPSGTVLAGTPPELYASDDGGLTWDIPFMDPELGAAMRDLDLRAGGVVQICGAYGELGSSSDDGTSFTFTTTCPSGRRRCEISDVDRIADGTLMAVGVGTWASQLITSTDQGLTWTSNSAPSLRSGGSVAFRTSTVGVVGGENVIASTGDGGLTWTVVDLTTIAGLEEGHNYVRDVAHRTGTSWSAAVKMNTEDLKGTILVSDDDGVTWTRRDTGLPSTDSYVDVEFVNADTGFLATMVGTIYETLDGGASWHLLSDDLYGEMDVLVEMVWLDSETVLMASDQWSPFLPGGIWRSDDRADTWEWVLGAIPVVDVDALDATTVCAVRSPNDLGLGVSMFVSGDGGRNWTEILTPLQERFGGYDVWFGARSGVCLPDGFLIAGENSELIRGFGNPAVDVAENGDVNPAHPGWADLRVHRRVGDRFRIGVRVHGSPTLPLHLDIHDVAGRVVRSLSTAARGDEDWIDMMWDGRDRSGRYSPAGLYFIHLRSERGPGPTEKVVLMR